MIKIKIISESDDYREDKEAIVRAMNNSGYECTIEQAGQLWELYSQSMCAGWMHVPKSDSEIMSCIASYFEHED